MLLSAEHTAWGCFSHCAGNVFRFSPSLQAGLQLCLSISPLPELWWAGCQLMSTLGTQRTLSSCLAPLLSSGSCLPLQERKSVHKSNFNLNKSASWEIPDPDRAALPHLGIKGFSSKPYMCKREEGRYPTETDICWKGLADSGGVLSRPQLADPTLTLSAWLAAFLPFLTPA